MYAYKLMYTYFLEIFFTFQPDAEDFAEEQWLMGRLVHLFQADSLDQQYMVSSPVSRDGHMICSKISLFHIIRY